MNMGLARLIFAIALVSVTFLGCENLKGEIGETCSSDGDCQGELHCEEGSSGTDQCTTTCVNSTVVEDYCTANYGSDYFCIGAGICVRSCQYDAECPSGTACNGYWWCERP